jgi:hypothetical protein
MRRHPFDWPFYAPWIARELILVKSRGGRKGIDRFDDGRRTQAVMPAG